MKRPFWQEARDQSAHMVAAAVALAPVLIWPDAVGGALSGLACGLIRETAQHGLIYRPGWGSLRDLLFWAAGGAALGVAATR